MQTSVQRTIEIISEYAQNPEQNFTETSFIELYINPEYKLTGKILMEDI